MPSGSQVIDHGCTSPLMTNTRRSRCWLTADCTTIGLSGRIGSAQFGPAGAIHVSAAGIAGGGQPRPPRPVPGYLSRPPPCGSACPSAATAAAVVIIVTANSVQCFIGFSERVALVTLCLFRFDVGWFSIMNTALAECDDEESIGDVRSTRFCDVREDTLSNVDLSGLARIRWVTRVSGFHVVRPVLRLADGCKRL